MSELNVKLSCTGDVLTLTVTDGSETEGIIMNLREDADADAMLPNSLNVDVVYCAPTNDNEAVLFVWPHNIHVVPTGGIDGCINASIEVGDEPGRPVYMVVTATDDSNPNGTAQVLQVDSVNNLTASCPAGTVA